MSKTTDSIAGPIARAGQSSTLIYPLYLYLTLALTAVGYYALFLEKSTPLVFLSVFRLDLISVVLLGLVSFLALIVGKYSLSYLDGEPRLIEFFKWLALVVASVQIMVIADHLILLFGAWLATSFCLHQLLLFYAERPRARLAARKKFWSSRMGDFSLMVAIVLTHKTFGTFSLSEVFPIVEGLGKGQAPASIPWIGLFFALGAMVKSAQFPFHFWLPETMDAPTPVSALMHAGIINAGGFLVIRLAPLLQNAELAHVVLALGGAWTAIFGALVMMTQNSIKSKLAYSTISQMGMMMLACGLGAYSIALFHLVAHSLYKAYSFLSTGQLVGSAQGLTLKNQTPSSSAVIVASTIGAAIVAAAIISEDGGLLATSTYVAVLVLGFVQKFRWHSGKTQLEHVIGLLAGFLALVFGVAAAVVVEVWLHNRLDALYILNGAEDFRYHSALCVATYFAFVVGLILSIRIASQTTRLDRRLYYYFWNGGYLFHRTESWFGVHGKTLENTK
jgi:NAD(P)H-quinone oxidoreductase subunit 5